MILCLDQYSSGFTQRGRMGSPSYFCTSTVASIVALLVCGETLECLARVFIGLPPQCLMMSLWVLMKTLLVLLRFLVLVEPVVLVFVVASQV